MKRIIIGFGIAVAFQSVSFAYTNVNIVGIDIDDAAITVASITVHGTVSIGGDITSAGAIINTPNTEYSALEVSSAIIPSSSFMVINGTGAITLTSTPTISTTTATNGQILEVMGGANAVTFQDDGTLSGSLLELGANSRAMGSGDILRLRFYGGKWYETGFVDN